MNAAPGFYGKVPTLGDFVSRRLPSSFIAPWDGWLQSAIAASRERLGTNWLDHYLVSPIWRFALSPGICSEIAWAGVIMPSVDRVGRYFPLTLASSVTNPFMLPFLFDPQCGWFEKLEELALSSLDDGFGIESFDTQLLALAMPNVKDQSCTGRNECQGAVRNGHYSLRLEMPDFHHAGRTFMALSAQLLEDFLPVYSLWGTLGSERVEPSLLVCSGLPPIDAYAALIGGQWPQRGWVQRTLRAGLTPCRGKPDAVQARSSSHGGESPEVSWGSHAISVVGNRRKLNEDAFLDQPERGLWMVADGMGGHQAGDVASRTIVDSLATLPLPKSLDGRLDAVRSCLESVNQELCRLSAASASGQIIGSTVVALLVSGNRCAYLWAGDSRLYRMRQGHLEQLTRDHSFIFQDTIDGLVETGNPSAAREHCNAITRAVGADENLELDLGLCDAYPGDRFLLCSDGLDKELSPREIAEQLSTGDCRASAAALVEAALTRKGRDNVTVIVVDVWTSAGTPCVKGFGNAS